MNWEIWYLIFPYNSTFLYVVKNEKTCPSNNNVKKFFCQRIFMPCNFFQKSYWMPTICLRKDIFHSNLIDKNFNVHVLYQNEYVKSAVQVQFPEEMYAISLGQQIHSRKKNEYYSYFFTLKRFSSTLFLSNVYLIIFDIPQIYISFIDTVFEKHFIVKRIRIIFIFSWNKFLP